MSHRLLLAIDEQWPTRPACPWVLLGPDGRPVSEGHSEPRHWPAAAECEVVLTGPQCLWLEVPLPRAKRADLPRLLAYALEDRLLKDPDTQHLTVSHRRPAGDGERELTGVLVVARERLRQITAQLAAIGRPPRRMLAEVQTAPSGGEAWQLSLSAAGAILRSGAEAGHAHAPALEAASHLALVNRGCLIAPFHNMMLVSPATTKAQIDHLIAAFNEILSELFAK